ncbi:MAG TPA: class II fructose-bisphosphate aldolase [Conexibacter sp.]
MLDRGIGMLREAQRDGWALAAFSVYNLEQALGVCRAAERTGVPLLLQAGSSAFAYAGERPLAALALAVADASSARVGVHLDHATSEDEIRRCLEAGYTSVMFDGSALPFEENVRSTRAVAALAHEHGAWVEAELAGFAGDEDRTDEAAAAGGALTDPAQAERLVAETGVDALAVAIGNVHGIPSAPVVLDFERLAAIRARVDVPLVLHGASGLPDDDVRRAIAGGVAKINVNTELRRSFRGALGAIAAAPPPGDGLADYLTPAMVAVRDVAEAKLRAFGACAREAVGDAR